MILDETHLDTFQEQTKEEKLEEELEEDFKEAPELSMSTSHSMVLVVTGMKLKLDDDPFESCPGSKKHRSKSRDGDDSFSVTSFEIPTFTDTTVDETETSEIKEASKRESQQFGGYLVGSGRKLGAENLLVEKKALAASARFKDSAWDVLVECPKRFQDSLLFGVGCTYIQYSRRMSISRTFSCGTTEQSVGSVTVSYGFISNSRNRNGTGFRCGI